MATLSNFTSELRTRNIARNNMFFVEIIAPSSVQGDIRSVVLWCESAQTPQSTILTNDNYLEAGTRRKYAYDQDYQNLTLSFYIDQGYMIKRFFDQWKNLTVPRNRNFGYPKDYTVETLNVYTVDMADNVTQCYEYKNVFPKSINSVDLSYENGGIAARFSVDFVFEETKSVEYTNGIDVKYTTKNSKVFVPENIAVREKNYHNAHYYETVTNPTHNVAYEVPEFDHFQYMFNSLLNTKFTK